MRVGAYRRGRELPAGEKEGRQRGWAHTGGVESCLQVRRRDVSEGGRIQAGQRAACR